MKITGSMVVLTCRKGDYQSPNKKVSKNVDKNVTS